MASTRFSRIDAKLRQLEQHGLKRILRGAQGRDFSSNDYLGLAHAPALRDATIDALARGVPVGAGGSRLLRGQHEEHEALEADAAEYFDAPACLAFGSGYAANLALMSLPRQGDLLIYDALIHASMHDGLRGTQATLIATPHNDADAMRDAVRFWRRQGGKGQVWIAVESLYSMDGDRAPLPDLLGIAEEEDGFLIADEAHATGVFGHHGAGLTEALPRSEALIALHTGGKALGVAGGLVSADRRVIALLISRARSFIYATAMPPLTAAILRESLKLQRAEPWRRERLHALIAFASQTWASIEGMAVTGSPIMPLRCGDSAASIAKATQLQQAGFDCRAIRPPTVPAGTARVRFSLTLNIDENDINAVASALLRA